MAKSSSWSKEFSCSAETLLGIITDPDFHKARSDLLENPSTTVKEISRTGEKLVFEVHCVEYAKGIKGVDKSKTEQSVTTYDFELRSRRGEWSYAGPQGKRVKVWGDMTVTEAGGGARLTQNFNVDVKIPLVGGQIEKLVIKESGKFWPKYEQLVSEFVQKAG
ncbi:MAG: DUF2505 domain-containing protein [bacterium]